MSQSGRGSARSSRGLPLGGRARPGRAGARIAAPVRKRQRAHAQAWWDGRVYNLASKGGGPAPVGRDSMHKDMLHRRGMLATVGAASGALAVRARRVAAQAAATTFRHACSQGG